MLQVTREGPCWHHQHRRPQSETGTASSSSVPHSNRPCQLYKAGACPGLGFFQPFHLGSCLYLLLSDQLCLLHLHDKKPAFVALDEGMTPTLQGLGLAADMRPHQPKIRSVIKLLDVGKSSISTRRELVKVFAVVDLRARAV